MFKSNPWCAKNTNIIPQILMLFDLVFLSQQWLIDIAFSTLLMRFYKMQ